MAGLALKGKLSLGGSRLALSGGSGKVTVDGKAALVVGATGNAPQPVIQPPPPASPIDPGVRVEVLASFNATVTAGGKKLVTQGMVAQGNSKSWPGMVMPGSAQVTVNGIPVNVARDRATIFPSGGSVTLDTDGQ